jgi:hypothetical protein
MTPPTQSQKYRPQKDRQAVKVLSVFGFNMPLSLFENLPNKVRYFLLNSVQTKHKPYNRALYCQQNWAFCLARGVIEGSFRRMFCILVLISS